MVSVIISFLLSLPVFSLVLFVDLVSFHMLYTIKYACYYLYCIVLLYILYGIVLQ